MKKINTTTHNNLHLLRYMHGDLKQKYIARKLGISQVAYCKMEKGDLKPSAETLDKLCNIYEIPTKEIFFLPADEVKRRLLHNTTAIDYTLKDDATIKMDVLKRQLNVMLRNLKNFFYNLF